MESKNFWPKLNSCHDDLTPCGSCAVEKFCRKLPNFLRQGMMGMGRKKISEKEKMLDFPQSLFFHSFPASVSDNEPIIPQIYFLHVGGRACAYNDQWY